MAAFLWSGLGSGLGSAAAATEGDDWVLMGRHGGCAELADAAKPKPVFAGVRTPDDLIAKAQAGGHEALVSEMDLGGAKGMSVNIKGLGLAVVFLPRSVCQRMKGQK